MKQGIYNFNLSILKLVQKIFFLFQDIEQLQSLLKQLEVRVAKLETKNSTPLCAKPEQKKMEVDEDDDDVDLFGSESEVSN